MRTNKHILMQFFVSYEETDQVLLCETDFEYFLKQGGISVHFKGKYQYKRGFELLFN